MPYSSYMPAGQASGKVRLAWGLRQKMLKAPIKIGEWGWSGRILSATPAGFQSRGQHCFRDCNTRCTLLRHHDEALLCLRDRRLLSAARKAYVCTHEISEFGEP